MSQFCELCQRPARRRAPRCAVLFTVREAGPRGILQIEGLAHHPVCWRCVGRRRLQVTTEILQAVGPAALLTGGMLLALRALMMLPASVMKELTGIAVVMVFFVASLRLLWVLFSHPRYGWSADDLRDELALRHLSQDPAQMTRRQYRLSPASPEDSRRPASGRRAAGSMPRCSP